MLREGADRGKGHAGCSRRERETCPQERGWVIQLHAGREPGSSALSAGAEVCLALQTPEQEGGQWCYGFVVARFKTVEAG